MKYLYKHATCITPPRQHEIPQRIQTQIESVWAWFYQLY
jgi:sulfotransferase